MLALLLRECVSVPGVVLATTIDSAGDLEEIAFKPVQARALHRLITNWKATGLPTDELGAVDCVAAASVHNTATPTATSDAAEYARRDATNSDYYLVMSSSSHRAYSISCQIQQSSGKGILGHAVHPGRYCTYTKM